MKLNSNTIALEEQDYKNLEGVIKKIASENNIEDVEQIQISLTANEGVISFKTAGKIPGVPDGTGPWGGTDKCTLKDNKKKPLGRGMGKGPFSGKDKNLGVPDGTGPRGGTPACSKK